MEAYGVWAFIKLSGTLMVLRLVWRVLVVIAVLLCLVNECLVVIWSALWRLIKVDYLDFTWRLSPRRRCPRRMCPIRMTPRRMTPRRMFPRRKAETDIPETGGTDGWRRRMALEEKPGRKDPPFSWLFVPGTSFCAIGLGPPSLGDGLRRDGCPRDGGRPPRRMSPRRRKAARDGCPWDGGRPPETDVAEMDVPETEGVFFQSLCPIWENVTDFFFFFCFHLSLWVQRYWVSAVLCLCSLCGLVAEWFRWQTNMRPAGWVMRAVLCWCGFRCVVAEWFNRQPNLRPLGWW